MPGSSTKPSSRVGITLVTGFLGAGKSTLIRRVLTENHQLRIVVVENEFAEDSTVEQAIVTQGIGPAALEDFIELPNGCICCAAQDDLTDALQRLVDAKRGSFDHILVEASGLADPGPVAASFWVDEGLDSPLFLDAVITIVDAVNLEGWLMNTEDTQIAELARKQLAVADLVLLNKVDLVEAHTSRPITSTGLQEEAQGYSNSDMKSKLSSIIDVVRYNGCTAEIIPTTRCNVELSRLLNIRAYDEGSALKTLGNVALPPVLLRSHSHISSIGSLTLTFEGDSFEADKLDRAFGEILWNDEEKERDEGASCEVWRMKGFAVISGEIFKRLYQSVHTLFDHSPSSVRAGDDMISRFVFIGRDLNDTRLREHLSDALGT